jgi:glycolate oxidase iron-sulfur subunit
MQTNLADWIKDTADGIEAQAILQRCVHCGFCTATCPTYQILGDDLDSPRGRIYLMKRVLEGAVPTESTQLHLDRCVTCRNCETTCPSGVQYGRLIDIGRGVVDQFVGRKPAERFVRKLLAEGLTSRWFGPALRLGQWVRPMLPTTLRNKVPVRHHVRRTAHGMRGAQRSHPRKMLLLAGCVQPAMQPNINAATARVFDRLGVELIVAPQAGCCGAIRYHLNDHAGGLRDARRNIDAWWPQLQAGAEAIVINASGCGTMIKEYGHLLRHDPLYADKAARVSAAAKDIAEVLPALRDALTPPMRARLRARPAQRVAFHPPCSLQHGQQIRGVVEEFLSTVGAEVLPINESHLCCGSAGTYSVLQPGLAYTLRDRKLENLKAPHPEVILSANIGCIAHLASGTDIPVMHWVEWFDERLGLPEFG